uniref:Proteasome activator Blm10 mid region domain-containing protein n=1 Tax=Ditylenchus dipsaci TaxID=166011 RepID=A0A915D7Y9_9BILA
MHSALTMKNLDFRVVKVVSSVLSTLLSRKNLLKRSDLELDWRPLYDLYVEISYKNLEEDGVLLLPENLKKVLGAAILECNSFFSESATQEILDEVRPYMCPLDDSMMRALSVLCLFLPTTYKPAEHDQFGAGLWYEELWHWFSSNECSPSLDDKILSIFARLAKDCPGYINWNDKFDMIFSRLLRTFKLELLLAYTLGGPDDGVQPHIDQLFMTLESYFYPSNNGAYTTNLLNFVLKLCTNVMYRVSRERYHPERQILKVPTHMKLTDKQIDNFVKRLLPSLKYGAFSKLKQELVPSIMRILSFLSPGIIIPAVLDLVYPALETVTEPHRLIQSLHILACICVPLVRDDPSKSQGERLPIKVTEEVDAHMKSYRCHALSILVNILPGIDVNDISKSTLTFQIVGILLLLIPVVDCSEAVHVCNDLTEEEKELCSATAVFDSFVEQLLNKIFAIIEMLGNSAQTSHTGDRQNLTKLRAKSMEEIVLERGVLTVFKALIRNCNSAVYEKVVESFKDFLKQSMFDSKPAMDTITRMTTILVSNKPAYAFPVFFKFASEKLEAHLSHEDVFQDEEVDTSVVWYMNLCSEIIRGAPGNVLLQHRQKIEKVVNMVANFKSKDAFYLAGSFSQNILAALCSIYPIPKSIFELLDQPFDKYLPIRHWAKTMDKKTWSIDWHVPSDGEVQFASDLVQKLAFENLDKLSSPESLTDSEMLKCLSTVRFSLEGASNLCPFFDVLPENVKPITAPNGENLRRIVFVEVKKLADYLLKKRENDTKSMLELIAILKILLHVKGLCHATYQQQFTNFQLTKRILADPLRGNLCIIESIAEGVLAFMHARRQLTKPLARHIFLQWRKNRVTKILDSSFSWWTYSYKLVIDDILEIINNAKTHTHQQFKGALYMLLNGKELSICVRQDWETLNKVWPSMVKAEHSEKPSIIALLETAHDIIVNNFSSFQIYFNFPQSIMPTAEKLLVDYENCVHRPVWPDLTASQLQTAQALENRRNDHNIKSYYKLCSEMLKLSTDSKLHWRHVDMAQSFLSLMLRRDMEFPEEAVLLFYKLLVSDTIKTRKMAIALMSSWMKIHKPKAVKKLHLIEHLGENSGPNAKWPIQYGFRKDNLMVVYDEQKQPRNAAEWNSTRFFFKVHWGFYTWPKEFKSYAPRKNNIPSITAHFLP